MKRLEIRLLGPFDVRLDGEPVEGFESAKVRALLAYLAVEADRPQRRDQLASLLWPDWPQKSAMSNLRYALSDLRKNIGDREAEPPFLAITRQTIQLDLESDCWVDVLAFEDALAPTTDGNSGNAVSRLRSAVEFYRSDFMEGVTLSDSPAFEDWTRAKGEYFCRKVLQALNDLVELKIEAGEYQDALWYARQAVQHESWHEPAHRQVIHLLALQGQRVEALAQYERLRETLRAELDIEPSQETRYWSSRCVRIRWRRRHPMSQCRLPPQSGGTTCRPS